MGRRERKKRCRGWRKLEGRLLQQKMRRGIDTIKFTIYALPCEEHINAKMCVRESETKGKKKGQREGEMTIL